MVIPLILGGALLARFAPTALAIGSRVPKYAKRFAGQPLGTSIQFGLGYGASTAVGYNLVPQFGRKTFIKSNTFTLSGMPYGRYYRNSNYSTRYSSRYPRRYRRRPTYRRYNQYSSRRYY